MESDGRSLVELEGTPCVRPEHEHFATELALTGNALLAYKRAYPDHTDRSARSNATRLARVADVARRVDELRTIWRKKLLERVGDFEAHLANLMTGKAAEVVDDEGHVLLPHELPQNTRAAITGLEFEIDDDGKPRKVKYRFVNQVDATRLWMQYHGMIVSRHDVTSGGRSLAEPIDLDALASEALERSKQRLGLATANVVDGEVVESVEREPPNLRELV